MKKPVSVPLFRRRWTRGEFVLLGLFFLLPFLAYGCISRVAAIEAVLLAAAGACLVVWLRGNWSLFGPHFYYDIIRLARRGRSTSIRIFYVTALLICLGFVYSDYLGRHGNFFDMLFETGIGVSNNAMARLAETFVGAILILQNLAVLVLTPAYVATCLTEERERRTLEMLFTTHLLDREIVLGKLSARLVHMGGVLLAGLPILSLAQFFGGVDMIVLLANFAITALNLWTVGTVCIMFSAVSGTALTAVLMSYLVLIPFATCLSCITAVFTSSPLVMISQRDFGGDYVYLIEVVGALVIVHGLISGFFVTTAIRRVRSFPELDIEATLNSSRDTYHRPNELREDVRKLPVEERIINRDHRRGVRKIAGDPLLWKETHTGGLIVSTIFWLPLASLMFPLVFVFLAILLNGMAHSEQEGREMRSLATVLAIGVAGLFCLGVAFRACISIARERQQGTLDGLLTLPVTLRDILKAKWQGALIRGWMWSVFYGFILSLAVVPGVFPVLEALLLLVAPMVHACFLASLGLFLSVVSRNVLSAQVRLVLIVVLILVFSVLADAAFSAREADFFAGFCMYMNPPACWHMLCYGPQESGRMMGIPGEYGLGLAVMSLVVYAVAALLLWLLACRLFALEQYRTRE